MVDNKKDKDDEQALVCSRCDMYPDYVSGCIVKKCSFCGADVWLSPASQKQKFDKIYCTDCWNLDYDGREDMCLMKESIEEFNEWHKKMYGYEMDKEDVIKKMEELVCRWVKVKLKVPKEE